MKKMMQKYYLATTGISDIWDLNSKLLLLGPWCLASEKNKKLLKGRDYTLIPTPWKPALKIKEAADYCHQVYEELLPQLCESLNSIHQVSYPVRYWRVLLGPWLLHFIGVLYDRYKRIEKATGLFPDLYTHTLPRKQCKLGSFDTNDFLSDKVDEDYYNFKIFSTVAYDSFSHNVIEKDYKCEPEIFTIRHSWKRKLFNKLLNQLGAFSKAPIVLSDMYHLVPLDLFLLIWKVGFNVIVFMDFESMGKTSLKTNYSHKIREAWKLKGASDRFQSLLYKAIPYAVPMSYLENYRFYRNSIKRIKCINSVRVVGSATGWFFNERLKYFTAEVVSKGASLIDFQHGGGYGRSLSIPVESITLEKDIVYTWGWNSKNYGYAKPLPSAHLSRLKDSHSPKLNDFLFVGATMPLYQYRLQTLLQSEDMQKYFEDKKVFFQSLPDETKNKVLYRPYIHDYGWGEVEAVKEVCPNAKFLFKGRLVDWMRKVKLVVIDHPQTSYIEALTINVPCIFYWDHEVYLMRPEAEEYFEVLRRAGILYKTPADAAKKLVEVFEDPVGWWKGEDLQEARNIFLEHAGYSRKDWAQIWAEELKQIQKQCINNGLTYEQE